MKNILVTGGAGFIGSHLVRLLVNKYPEYHIINMDVLTYAGNLKNLKDIESKKNYSFVKCDICDFEKVKQIFKKHKIDSVIHLAAESHVDRSIIDPFSFAQTNVMGTLSLLQAAKEYWDTDFKNKLFYHVSTDEVYGSLGEEGSSSKLITYVDDRAGHDLRYAIDSTKLKDELGWEPSLQFKEGIEKTVSWYLDNKEWIESITSGDYQRII